MVPFPTKGRGGALRTTGSRTKPPRSATGTAVSRPVAPATVGRWRRLALVGLCSNG